MVGIIRRLGMAAAIALGASRAMAGEAQDAVEAERVAAVGRQLVAMVEADGPRLDSQLETLASWEVDPLVHAWIVSIQIHRAKRGEALAGLRNGFAANARGLGFSEVAAVADIDRLVTERLLSLAVTRPREVLLYSAMAPLDQKVVDRVREKGGRWLLNTMLGDADANVRRAAAAMMPLVETDEGQMLSLLVDALQPPMIDEWDARVPWANGPLFIPGMPLTDDERKALERSLRAWVRWGEAHGRDDAQQPAMNALWQVSPRAARRVR